MLPNVLFALNHKSAFGNKFQNIKIEWIEQIRRYGCFIFMIFNITATWFWWRFDKAVVVYIVVNLILIILYLTIWFIC